MKYADLTTEQRLKIYGAIQRRIQRDFLALGFLGGFMAGIGTVLLLTGGKS